MPPAMLWLVIPRRLIDQPPVARHVGEQHPAGPARQSVGQRDELLTPAVDRSEITGDRVRHRLGRRSSVTAETGEIQFVQQRRVERGGFVALQAADDVAGVVAGSSASSSSVIAFRRSSALP